MRGRSVRRHGRSVGRPVHPGGVDAPGAAGRRRGPGGGDGHPARVTVLVVLVACGVLAGCGTPVATLDIPPAPSTAPPVGARAVGATTTTVDPSGVSEPTVPGSPTTTAVALRPGVTTIGGTVSGPAGPVGGATVEIDRLVGDQVATTEVVSGPGGTFVAAGLLGGRYRLRAWKAPTLAMTSSEIFFVADGGTHQSDLTLTGFRGPTVTSSIAPDPPQAGQPATLAVQLSTPTVSSAGTVGYVPLVGDRVQVVAGGQWTFRGRGLARTDAQGLVAFVVSCGAPGDDPLTVIVERTMPVTLTTPACAPAPAPPPAPTTTTAPTVPATTSTTRPRR